MGFQVELCRLVHDPRTDLDRGILGWVLSAISVSSVCFMAAWNICLHIIGCDRLTDGPRCLRCFSQYATHHQGFMACLVPLTVIARVPPR